MLSGVASPSMMPLTAPKLIVPPVRFTAPSWKVTRPMFCVPLTVTV